MTVRFNRRAALTFTAAATALAACQTRGEVNRERKKGLGEIDAVETARRIRAGEITSYLVTEAAIDRTHRVNEALNAVVTKFYDAGQRRAYGSPQGPLGGVPFAVKDLNGWEGVPTHYGSRALHGSPAEKTAFMDRIAQIGLVPIVKSATPELGLTATTEPVSSGPCRNPWDPARSTGGSSGGSAALVAAGALPLAHANDGGGSIRIPAASCGLVGLKPSRGRLFQEDAPAQDPATDLAVQGCVSRSVRDTAAFLAAMERPGHGLAAMGLVTGPSRRRLRIGWSDVSMSGTRVDPDVAASVRAAAKLCRSLRHTVRPVSPQMDGKAFEDAFLMLWSAGAAQSVQGWSERAGRAAGPEQFEPWTLYLAQRFAARRDQFPAALATLRSFARDYERIMLDGIDILVTPVTGTPAPNIGHLAPTLDGQTHYDRVAEFAAFTPFQNVAGAPAISLPLGVARDGMPIGIQFSARVGDEKTLLELAYQLEDAEPWAKRTPKVWAGKD